jgi:hypothetical protein
MNFIHIVLKNDGACGPFKLSCLAIETSSGSLQIDKLTVSVQC